MNRFSTFGFIPTANDVDAFIPEFWAQETLAILQENMVISNLVHRDFENIVSDMGDTVNTRQPSEFTAVRLGTDDDVTVQDATATNVPVVLNQWLHTTFKIKDSDLSKSMADLVQIYIAPAGLSLGRFVDQCLLNQYIGYVASTAGSLGGLSSSNARDYVVEAGQRLDEQKCYEAGRNLILNTAAKATILKNDLFVSAEKRGDGGSALETARLGSILGFDTYMCQNMPNINTPAAAAFKNGAINNSAGYPVGTTALVVDGFSGAVASGNWLTINGLPYQVASHTESLSNTVSITLNTPLRAAVADNDVIKSYVATTVNMGSTTAAGYSKFITLTSTTYLAVGQAISFGTTAGTAIYTIQQITGSTVLLDRPLDASLADSTAVNPGPTGGFNLAFHRNAMALVSRPLATPAPGTGARSAIVNGYGLSMRATITYEGRKLGHLVTLDMLFGVKILKTALATLLLS